MASSAAHPRRQDLQVKRCRTVTRHYRLHQKGEATSTNPIASIFAWTRGLAFRAARRHARGEAFMTTLEDVCVKTVEGGQMTKDLAMLVEGDTPWLTTEEFLDALDTNLGKAMAG